MHAAGALPLVLMAATMLSGSCSSGSKVGPRLVQDDALSNGDGSNGAPEASDALSPEPMATADGGERFDLDASLALEGGMDQPLLCTIHCPSMIFTSVDPSLQVRGVLVLAGPCFTIPNFNNQVEFGGSTCPSMGQREVCEVEVTSNLGSKVVVQVTFEAEPLTSDILRWRPLGQGEHFSVEGDHVFVTFPSVDAGVDTAEDRVIDATGVDLSDLDSGDRLRG
jgi:hypothetical protein